MREREGFEGEGGQLGTLKEKWRLYIKTEHMEMRKEQVRRESTRCRRNLKRPIVSSAFTGAMMHHAAGPLLSLKLYEASLAHILLQWRHCLAHSSLAADWCCSKERQKTYRETKIYEEEILDLEKNMWPESLKKNDLRIVCLCVFGGWGVWLCTLGYSVELLLLW